MYVPLYIARRYQYQETTLWNGGAEITQLGYALDEVGFRILAGARYFFSKTSIPALGRSQRPIQWAPRAFFPGGKAAGA